MLEAIYSSKMFLASKNKDKIRSAIADPMNGELVQQLRNYLDDDFLKESAEYHAEKEMKEESTEVPQVDEGSSTSERSDSFGESPSRPSGGSTPRHSLANDMSDLGDMGVPDENDSFGDFDTDTETSDTDSTSDESVEESVTVKKKGVSANKNIMPDLMAILNSSEVTNGVRRVNATQDSELWIYYNDDVNLNHVMESVISSVNTCCPNVQFSRLARTYNAVVFSV